MNNGQDWTEETYTEAEQAIGYVFSDKKLLKTCFTHSTYRNNVDKGCEDNERLEFLGDAVLQFIVSDDLYHRRTGDQEGELTDLRKGFVSKEALTPISRGLGLWRFMRHSNRAEDMGGKNGKVHSSLYEAVVAGIYLDGGLGEAKKFLGRTLKYRDMKDHITALQHYAQERGEREPRYLCREQEEGARFLASVTVCGVSAEGGGSNKQSAKSSAAEKLLKLLKERDGN